MTEIMAILFSTVLVNNFVLSKFLGICPFLGVSKKLDSAVGMGLAVVFVMTLATAFTWPIFFLILEPSGLEYLSTIIFALVIAGLVQFVEIVLRRYFPPLYRSLGVYLPLMATNCAILGVALLNINDNYTFIQALANAVGGGIGFLLAMVMFAGVRSRMESGSYSKSFEGVPITLVAASIVALCFMGFGGVVEGIFG